MDKVDPREAIEILRKIQLVRNIKRLNNQVKGH
jgi:hypothetical protein